MVDVERQTVLAHRELRRSHRRLEKARHLRALDGGWMLLEGIDRLGTVESCCPRVHDVSDGLHRRLHVLRVAIGGRDTVMMCCDVVWNA